MKNKTLKKQEDKMKTIKSGDWHLARRSETDVRGDLPDAAVITAKVGGEVSGFPPSEPIPTSRFRRTRSRKERQGG